MREQKNVCSHQAHPFQMGCFFAKTKKLFPLSKRLPIPKQSATTLPSPAHLESCFQYSAFLGS
jgi:hypothetical protein